jgi:hypothetical protein
VSALFGILATLFGGAITALAKFFLGRKAATAADKAAQQRTQAEANESTTRDETAHKVATDREKNDALLDAARHDAGSAGGLRKQSTDIAAAISDADSEVR